jgi:hypothetical protein
MAGWPCRSPELVSFGLWSTLSPYALAQTEAGYAEERRICGLVDGVDGMAQPQVLSQDGRS